MVVKKFFDSISCQGEGGSCAFRASRIKHALMEPATQQSHEDAIERVWSGDAKRAIVPVMNLRAGSQPDVIKQIPNSDSRVVGEVYLPIDHYLLLPRQVIESMEGVPGDGKKRPVSSPSGVQQFDTIIDERRQRALLAQVTQVYADPQAFKQCDRTLRNSIPGAVRQITNCTSEAAKVVHQHAVAADVQPNQPFPIEAAVASLECAQMYDLYPIKLNVQDLRDRNYTRYLVLAQDGNKKLNTDNLRELVQDIDLERLRRLFGDDRIENLFENVRLGAATIHDVWECWLPKGPDLHELVGSPTIDHDPWPKNLNQLYDYYLQHYVGESPVQHGNLEANGYNPVEEAHNSPFEKVKLLYRTFQIGALLDDTAFEYWLEDQGRTFGRQMNATLKTIRRGSDLVNKERGGDRSRLMSALNGPDYEGRINTMIWVRSKDPKVDQHALVQNFFRENRRSRYNPNAYHPRIVDVQPEAAGDGNKTNCGHWMIVEVDGYLGHYRPKVAKGWSGKKRVTNVSRRGIEGVLSGLIEDGLEVKILGSFAKDATWEPNWRHEKVEKVRRSAFSKLKSFFRRKREENPDANWEDALRPI